jgi:hypothetical protein
MVRRDLPVSIIFLAIHIAQDLQHAREQAPSISGCMCTTSKHALAQPHGWVLYQYASCPAFSHLNRLAMLRGQVSPLCYPLLHLSNHWILTSPGQGSNDQADVEYHQVLANDDTVTCPTVPSGRPLP